MVNHLNEATEWMYVCISICLRKVEMVKAEGILIAPIWPTQVWWPQMLSLLIRHPVDLPQQKRLLQLPSTSQNTPALSKTSPGGLLHIRRSLKQEEFQNHLMASRSPGTQKQYQVYIQKWSNFYAQKKKITINQL